jgi:uncharacterized protein YcfJ
MKTFTKHAIALAVAAFATQAAAQVTLYDREGFDGRSVTTSTYRVDTVNAASLVIRDNNMWEACDGPGFQGFCSRLLPGQYASLASMGHRNRIASIRMINEAGEQPRVESRPDYRDDRRDFRAERRDFRRRSGERVYDVQVSSVRAVVGAAEQRCWVEREQVSSYSRPSVGGAIAGAVIGGILGHQIGSGRGQDVATVGGAVAGGAIGANVGRNRGGEFQDVQRCTNVSNQAPAYWDVTYFFRGQEHRIQMSSPPGQTIQVNESGEPRA